MAAMTWLVASAQSPEKPAPTVGRSLRYCNPLSIETSSHDGSPQGVQLRDVTVIREGGKYFPFATGGAGWVSGDLVNWKYEGVEMREGRVPVAPHVVKYNGQFYTTVMSNPPGGRRIGMDPVGFDERGNLFVRGPSETPQWAPGVVPDPARDGDSGSLPLTVGKVRAMNARSTFSSQRPGHDAAYALDNSTGTWWEPADDDSQPSITVHLGPATELDPVQSFTVDSSRVLFAAARGFARSGTTPAAPTTGAPAHRYKIEVSTDGKTFTTLLDKTRNAVTKYVEFDELPPTTCQFVRLTLTDWPHNAGTPFGIIEFTVFGTAVSPAGPPDPNAKKPAF
jgi:hypothetical protein